MRLTSAVEWIEFQGRPARLSAMIGHRLFYLHTSLAKVGQTGHVSNAILLNTFFWPNTGITAKIGSTHWATTLSAWRVDVDVALLAATITSDHRSSATKITEDWSPPSSKKKLYLKNNKYAIKCHEVACCINMMGANILWTTTKYRNNVEMETGWKQLNKYNSQISQVGCSFPKMTH